MYKHIVMWDFMDVENKLELANEYKKQIEALVGVIPGLIRCECHFEMADGCNSDIVLETLFDTLENLVSYRTNPNHRAIGDKFKKILLTNKRTADFKI